MKNETKSPVSHASLPEAWLMKEDQTSRYFHVPEAEISAIVRKFREEHRILICIFAIEELEKENRCCLMYVFEEPDSPKLLVLVQSGENPSSIAHIFPSASLFEREIADGFGITFTNTYDSRRLFLHESYPEEFHPLVHTFTNRSLPETVPCEPYPFRMISGAGVYQVPVGPVHAGIIEPGHFRFSVIGETIVNLEVRFGFLHRGIEKLAEGKIPAEGVRIAESVSGDESVVNACGFCQAVEQISGIAVPRRAEYIRGLLLELERAYSLISDLAGMLTDIAQPATSSRFIILRELLQREADILTGSRFMKDFICIGGVKRDIATSKAESLFRTAGETERRVQEISETALSIPTVLDRFSTTGMIKPALIEPLALSGPVARASGSTADVRIDHPYGVYRENPPAQVYEPGGDVLARFTLKVQEVLASLRYIQELILFMPEGSFCEREEIRDGYALVTLESPRGMTLHFVHVVNGTLHRYKVRTASFCNWYAIEHAVIGNIVPDFPLINKSLNLSYAGTDL